jgi:hypothetical protein
MSASLFASITAFAVAGVVYALAVLDIARELKDR